MSDCREKKLFGTNVCQRKDPTKAYEETNLVILNAVLTVFWYILTKSSQGHDNAETLVAFPKRKTATRGQTKGTIAAKR